MRYQPEHKLEIHPRIVKDASRRLRAKGLNGAAVSAVMKDAGLTHGGFYKHFSSKDDLLLERFVRACAVSDLGNRGGWGEKRPGGTC